MRKKYPPVPEKVGPYAGGMKQNAQPLVREHIFSQRCVVTVQGEKQKRLKAPRDASRSTTTRPNCAQTWCGSQAFLTVSVNHRGCTCLSSPAHDASTGTAGGVSASEIKTTASDNNKCGRGGHVYFRLHSLPSPRTHHHHPVGWRPLSPSSWTRLCPNIHHLQGGRVRAPDRHCNPARCV